MVENALTPVAIADGESALEEKVTQLRQKRRGQGMTRHEAGARIAARLRSERSPDADADGDADGDAHRKPPKHADAEQAEKPDPRKASDRKTASSKQEETDADSSKRKAKPPADDDNLPNSLDEIAEALGVSVEDLSKRLKVSRKSGDAEEQVALADAIRDHMLHHDYSRQVSELDQRRATAEAEHNKVMAEWAQRVQSLEALGQHLHRFAVGDSADLDRILEEQGVDAYKVARAQQDHARRILQALNQEAEQLRAAQQQREQQYRHQERVRLQQLKPELQIPEKQHAFAHALMDGLQREFGFSKAEAEHWLTSAWDHRHVLIVDDALAYRKMLKDGNAALKAVSKLPKPGTVTTPGAETDIDPRTLALRDRLLGRKTGRISQIRQAGEMIARRLAAEPQPAATPLKRTR